MYSTAPGSNTLYVSKKGLIEATDKARSVTRIDLYDFGSPAMIPRLLNVQYLSTCHLGGRKGTSKKSRNPITLSLRLSPSSSPSVPPSPTVTASAPALSLCSFSHFSTSFNNCAYPSRLSRYLFQAEFHSRATMSAIGTPASIIACSIFHRALERSASLDGRSVRLSSFHTHSGIGQCVDTCVSVTSGKSGRASSLGKSDRGYVVFEAQSSFPGTPSPYL